MGTTTMLACTCALVCTCVPGVTTHMRPQPWQVVSTWVYQLSQVQAYPLAETTEEDKHLGLCVQEL